MKNKNRDMTPEEKSEKLDHLRELADQAAIKMEKGKTILTFTQAALYLDYKYSYLYKLTCKNKIPFRKPNGKKLYFFKEELEEWVDRYRRKKNCNSNKYDEQIKKQQE